jgi:formylglycine-generating enzyme required for sulfatase activity
MRWLRVTAALAVAGLATACVSLLGLDEIERVSCLDCADAATDAAPETGEPAEAAVEAGPRGCGGDGGASWIDAGSFCIDSHEVTNAEYALFWAATAGGTDVRNQPSFCSWNLSFTPRDGWPFPQGRERHPVVWVDWCDAYAYCAWVGKRLCGKLDGGPADYAEFANAANDQWFNACSRGGTRAYPYGNEYDAGVCNGFDSTDSGPIQPPGAYPRCLGGYDGLLDMSGNVREWEDSCSASAGANDNCRVRGGAASESGASFLRCGFDAFRARSFTSTHTGIRCCSLAE